ncbi:hypothetical protein BCU64_002915 [Vibrio lentus]|nr:hypothetical protein [Vibrio lentus]PMH60272.1 hypothetical protein BCU64_19385 [Vibrio lentus]
MGIGSNYMVELMQDQYEEAKADWIREQVGNPEADEFNTDGWDELSDAYDELSSSEDPYYENWEDENWEEPEKSRLEVFQEAVEVTSELLSTTYKPSINDNVLIMLHGHIVAALEGYLSSTFISLTLLSDDNIQKLVESDPEFAKRSFTLKEIFSKRESLKSDIAVYLQDLIFHKVSKVSLMYRSVLSIEFGDVAWLYKAVTIRHHCVHRAGYDKDGIKIELTKQDINALMKMCISLVEKIDKEAKVIVLNHFKTK